MKIDNGTGYFLLPDYDFNHVYHDVNVILHFSESDLLQISNLLAPLFHKANFSPTVGI